MYNRDNLKLRLNLVKRAVITYELGDDTSVVIDIFGDGKIRINDNGIVRDYDVEKYFTDGILHKSLGNILIEETDGKGRPDEGEIVEWKVEFFNRKHLDHVIYGTKRTPINIQRELKNTIFYLERHLSIDLGAKYLDSLYASRKAEQGNPAVVSEQMRTTYFRIMTKIIDRIAGTAKDKNTNMMISPLSLVYALSVLMEVTSGETQSEISRFFDNQFDEVKNGAAALTEDFLREASQVKAANAVYVDDLYKEYVQKAFLEAVRQEYHADYLEAGPERFVSVVNDWVSRQTNGMVKDIVDHYDPLNIILILNALAFEARWFDDYEDDDIERGTFHNEDGTECKVSMLCSGESRLLINKKVIGFLKPYKEAEYYFAGILPQEGHTVESVMSEMTAEEWRALFDRTRRADVDVKIPEFDFEYAKDLTDILKDLGITSVFDQNRSDLHNMITINEACIKKVVQKTYIDVNRKGTRAAAVTGMWAVAAGISSYERYEVHLDRPFIFAIVHRNAGIPIFIGAVKRLE